MHVTPRPAFFPSGEKADGEIILILATAFLLILEEQQVVNPPPAHAGERRGAQVR